MRAALAEKVTVEKEEEMRAAAVARVGKMRAALAEMAGKMRAGAERTI